MDIGKKRFSPEVTALGTCNIDFLLKVPRFSQDDDEVDVEKLNLSLGGSASNFAVNLSRLGVDVGIIARIGNDAYGSFILDTFKKEGINTDRLLRISESTGMAFIAVDKKGERSIYTFMGANSQFKLERGDVEYIKGSKLLHVTGMYKELVEKATKQVNILSFNPGTVLSSYGIDELSNIMKRVHILFLNRKEVFLLTGKDYPEGAKELVDLGIPMVVITCGKDGARLYTPEGVVHSSTIQTESLDTTGAGDAFAAGFISCFIKNKQLNECLDMGNYVASNCVDKLGAVNIPINKF